MYKDKHGMIWYKGNLHTHTTRSDGLKAPEDTVSLYADAGYDFIALTDHWILGKSNESKGNKEDKHGNKCKSENNDSKSERKILVMSGIEYDTGSSPVDGIYHILGIGMDDNTHPDLKRGSGAQAIINEINRCSGLAILAHPAWSLNTPAQIMSLKGIGGTEIFNSVSDLPHNSRPYSGLLIDMLATLGNRIPCFASDDTHFYDGEETRSWIMVRCPLPEGTPLSSSSILSAIRAGGFYATQGPHFEVYIDHNSGSNLKSSCKSGTITVECPEECDVDSVVFYSDSVYVTDRSTCRNTKGYGIYRNSKFSENRSDSTSLNMHSTSPVPPTLPVSQKQSKPSSLPESSSLPITIAHYKIKPADTFVRIEVNDSVGRQAWSSPIRVG